MFTALLASALAVGGAALFFKKKEEKEQIERGRLAIKIVLKTKKDFKSAMTHPKLGDIDFVYGFHNRAARTGCGISHISGSAADKQKIFKDNETGGKILYRVPEIIMRGEIQKTQLNRLKIIYEGYQVILGKDYKGGSGHWLFNAYDIAPEKKQRRKRPRKKK